MYKLASLASILTIAITSVLCAPGKHSVHHHQLSSSSGKNSTSSTTPWNAHYRHLRFGQRGYRPNQTRRHALPIPMKSDYPTILGGSLTYTHRTPTRRQNMNTAPTPAPTGYSSSLTSIHINNVKDFSFILPNAPNESISAAEADGEAWCSDPRSGCASTIPEGLIAAAEVTSGPSWIQITGCLDPSKFPFAPNDDGGQFDVRYPNGAECTYGGYGASFIEQVEPAARRFCLRCCADANDQVNCNSHQDRAGCAIAVPGRYDFPEIGISCA